MKTIAVLLMSCFLLSFCSKRNNSNEEKQEEEKQEIFSNDNSNSTSPVNILYTGIVNDNAVRIREQPSIESTVSGQLNQGLTVTVLGRSEKRMFLDGYDSYWLKIKTDSTEGWAYGAFINLTDTQYTLLPVLSNKMQVGVIDLNYTLQDMNEQEWIQKEKETLRLQSSRFPVYSVEDLYKSIVNTFNKQQSLRPFF